MTPLFLSLTLAVTQGAGCVQVEGEQIFAADLAQPIPAFASLPRETVLGYSPAPGARRVLRGEDLRRISRRLGLSMPPVEDICVTRLMEPLKEEAVMAALKGALPNPPARLEIVDYSRYPVSPGKLKFEASGFQATAGTPLDAVILWRGYMVSGTARRQMIWARVRVRLLVTRILARSDIAAGSLIEPRHFQEEPIEVLPFTTARLSPAEVIGKVARRRISGGAAIQQLDVMTPQEIRRGDLVEIQVRQGAALLRMQATAETPGSRGMVITVRNPASGKRFRALVIGPHKALAGQFGIPGKENGEQP